MKLLISLLVFVSTSAFAGESVMGYKVVGEFMAPTVKDSVEWAIESNANSGQQYELVQVGCGTQCLSYLAVIDYSSKTVYAMSEAINALTDEPEIIAPELIFDFSAIMVAGKQKLFTQSGVYSVDGDVVEGRFLSEAIGKANQVSSASSRYLPVNVGCGTECFSLLAILDTEAKSLIVLDEDQRKDVYQSEAKPTTVEVKKQFFYDGSQIILLD